MIRWNFVDAAISILEDRVQSQVRIVDMKMKPTQPGYTAHYREFIYVTGEAR